MSSTLLLKSSKEYIAQTNKIWNQGGSPPPTFPPLPVTFPLRDWLTVNKDYRIYGGGGGGEGFSSKVGKKRDEKDLKCTVLDKTKHKHTNTYMKINLLVLGLCLKSAQLCRLLQK